MIEFIKRNIFSISCLVIATILIFYHLDGWGWFLFAAFVNGELSVKTKPKRKHLISFGNYLLSDERRKSFEQHSELGTTNIEERLKEVHHADVENWKSKQTK